jgi:signal transduction histidine kinase
MNASLISAFDGIAFVSLITALLVPLFYRKGPIRGGSLTLLLSTQLAYLLIATSKLGESTRMWPGTPELGSTLYLAGTILFVFYFYAFDRNATIIDLRSSISGHQSATSALSTQARLMASFLNSLPDPLVVVAADERVVFSNSEFASCFLPEPDSFISSVQDLPLSARSLIARCTFEEVAAVGQPVTRILNLPDRGRNGEVFHVSAFPIKADGEEVSLVLYHMHDITPETQILEVMLRERKARSLDTLLAGISHEFNNLLAGISGIAQIITDYPPTGDEASNYMKKVEELVARGETLVGELSGAAKHVGEGEIVDAGVILEKGRASLEDVLPDGIKLRLSISEPGLFVRAEQDELLLAVANLIANAGEASLPGGTVAVHVSRAEMMPPNEAMMHPELSADVVRISVTDSGRGIPESERERVFDPFYTTWESHRGMGLPMAHSIASRYHGHLRLERSDELGTEFALYFPATSAPTSAVQ